MNEKIKKELDGMSQEQLKDVDTYIDGLLGEDEAGEKAQKAEVSTVMSNAYRGKS